MIRVDVYLESPAAILAVGAFGAGAKIRIESASSSGGPFAEVGTVDVDASVVQPFTYWDAAGTASSWYRWRISDTANTTQSPYSSPFQGASPTDVVAADSYAQLADVLALFETPVKATRFSRLASLLRTATRELIAEMQGRDYFRHPASGSETWYVPPDRITPRDPCVLHFHDGLIALDALEYSSDGAVSFTSIAAGDYVLRGSDPDNPAPVPDGEPYFHLVFTGRGTVGSVPVGVGLVRATGARGWPAVPRPVVEGVAERARQLAFADPSASGSVQGPDGFEYTAPLERWPQVLYRWIDSERHRFWCHV